MFKEIPRFPRKFRDTYFLETPVTPHPIHRVTSLEKYTAGNPQYFRLKKEFLNDSSRPLTVQNPRECRAEE